MGGGSIGGVKLPSLNEVADVAANIFTGGLVGVNDDDQLEAGIVARNTYQGLKDVTGATAAEEANNITKHQIDAQKEALE